MAVQNERKFARRRELFAKAAPVFRRHGYRGATLKALANACGLSMPGLYRYFPSKRALALYPLITMYPELHPPAPDVTAGDPRVHLMFWIDGAVAELPNYSLALRLTREIDLRPEERRRIEASVQDHVTLMAGIVRRAAPDLDQIAAAEVASSMVTLATGPAMTGLEQEGRGLRRQLRALLRGYGVVLPSSTRQAG